MTTKADELLALARTVVAAAKDHDNVHAFLAAAKDFQDAAQASAIIALIERHRAEVETLRNTSVNCELFCPACGKQHIDQPQPEKGWTNPPHRTHECQHCGHLWRPYPVATNGVVSAEVERLTREKNKVEHDVQSVIRSANALASQLEHQRDAAESALAAERKRCGELERLVQCLLDNDPNADAADGVSVLDVWRRDARAALAGKDAQVTNDQRGGERG